ncbi:MAG TPA: thioredoxin [Edaphocola sp.]|nr:thioredoxin [Edaphocola sp.]
MMDKFNELVNDDKPVLIDFYATWCGPCQTMAPILENVKDQIGDQARVVKIDVDKFQEIAAKFEVRSIPTLMMFKQGKIIWRHTGIASTNELMKQLKNNI